MRAMPYADVPRSFRSYGSARAVAALALEFCILKLPFGRGPRREMVGDRPEGEGLDHPARPDERRPGASRSSVAPGLWRSLKPPRRSGQAILSSPANSGGGPLDRMAMRNGSCGG